MHRTHLRTEFMTNPQDRPLHAHSLSGRACIDFSVEASELYNRQCCINSSTKIVVQLHQFFYPQSRWRKTCKRHNNRWPSSMSVCTGLPVKKTYTSQTENTREHAAATAHVGYLSLVLTEQFLLPFHKSPSPHPFKSATKHVSSCQLSLLPRWTLGSLKRPFEAFSRAPADGRSIQLTWKVWNLPKTEFKNIMNSLHLPCYASVPETKSW